MRQDDLTEGALHRIILYTHDDFKFIFTPWSSYCIIGLSVGLGALMDRKGYYG